MLFDGQKLRFESVNREYSYTYSPDEAKAQEIAQRADSMDRKEAVRAGLLRAFEQHEVIASDGVTLASFRHEGANQGSTTIQDPAGFHGTSASYFFDPRRLGLASSLSSGGTIEAYLGYHEAKSIQLLGEESVDGVPAWHVQVRNRNDVTLDFWIDVARPIRVLKQAVGGDFAYSKYDDANPRDPIPIEVTTINSSPRNAPVFTTRFTRVKAEFDLRVDPASFTLAGLGMPAGTQVSDMRIGRSLGHWTGTGLDPVPWSERKNPPPARNLSELLPLLENFPASPEALDAATWIILNTPDGVEVEKAADVIRREHLGNTNLVNLCKGLERLRHRCSTNLLAELLEKNPSAHVRAQACYLLAKLRKEEADFGRNAAARAEAEKLFERVITEFGGNGVYGFDLAWHAKPELSELRRLMIGQPAPEIESENLDGQTMKLSDHRGRVVVLFFWRHDYIEASEHRKLLERMEGKPFSLLGVFIDDDLAKGKANVEKYKVTWPSFWDKRGGPISTDWNVNSWPDIWVLDRQGVIRYRDVRWNELTEAVESLLRE